MAGSIGKLRVEKGKAFERAIAADLRKLWPGADIHRSSQAERAREPDVVIGKGAPALAQRLWLELQDAAQPSPLTKLIQAEGDIAKVSLPRFPLVVWHKIREQSIQATTRLWVLNEFARPGVYAGATSMVVTFSWDDFKVLLSKIPLGREGA